MKIACLKVLILLATALHAAAGFAQPPDAAEGTGYSNDPSLIDSAAVPPAASATLPLSIEARDNQTNLQLDTPLLTPYLGAAKRPAARPDDMPPLPGAPRANPLDDYHLEAGFGVPVTDKANLNLGYRFLPRPSLIDERTGDPAGAANDLRFSFDIKLPFR